MGTVKSRDYLDNEFLPNLRAFILQNCPEEIEEDDIELAMIGPTAIRINHILGRMKEVRKSVLLGKWSAHQ